MQQICHRDLKLENTLLDGSPAPRLKICDFGYSKVGSCENQPLIMPSNLVLLQPRLLQIFQSSVFHSQPKSTVGTPAYIAPEVLSRIEYDGKVIIVSLISFELGSSIIHIIKTTSFDLKGPSSIFICNFFLGQVVG